MWSVIPTSLRIARLGRAFFDCLKIYGKEKRPTVFFDDVGERNDKTDFYAALKNFIDKNNGCDVLVVLIGRPWKQVEITCQTIPITPYSTQEIAETPSVSDKDSVDIFCLSAGITELLSLYDTSLSFEENVKALLHINSPFYRLMKDKMCECFRTPESYNTLLYAMVNGYNRIASCQRFQVIPKTNAISTLKRCVNLVLSARNLKRTVTQSIIRRTVTLLCGIKLC